MPPIKYLSTFFLLLVLSVYGSAQSQAASDAPDQFSLIALDAPNALNGDLEEALFSDREHALYFIDFEKVSVPLYQVMVRDAEGRIITREIVAELPVDTIYEIDLSEQAPGAYHIELQSHSKKINYSLLVSR